MQGKADVFVTTKPRAIVPRAPELRPALIVSDALVQVRRAAVVVVVDDVLEVASDVVVVEDVGATVDVVDVVVTVDDEHAPSKSPAAAERMPVRARHARIYPILLMAAAKSVSAWNQYRP